MFGNDTNVDTIILKTLVDQFVYSVFWSMPVGLTAYRFRDSRFNPRAVVSMLRSRQFWRRELPQTIIGSWLVWFPAVLLVSALICAHVAQRCDSLDIC